MVAVSVVGVVGCGPGWVELERGVAGWLEVDWSDREEEGEYIEYDPGRGMDVVTMARDTGDVAAAMLLILFWEEVGVTTPTVEVLTPVLDEEALEVDICTA